MLLSACVLCFAGLGRAEKAGEVLEVGPDSRFKTIRDALAGVPETLTVPHLVRVHGGRYAPFAISGKQASAVNTLTVAAAGVGEVILDGRGEERIGIDCNISHVTIRGFVLKGLTYAGINVGNAKSFQNVRIMCNRIYESRDSIKYVNTGKLSEAAIAHNVVLGGESSGIRIMNAWGARVWNNTVCLKSSAGIHIQGRSGRITLRNNIVAYSRYGGQISVRDSAASDLDSDYNCFFTFPRDVPGWRSRAFVGKYGLNVCDSLREWQLLSGQDRHSLFADPIFCGVGLRGKLVVTDAHLQSTAGALVNGKWIAGNGHSPGIDAGDPTWSFEAEPAPDGGRINLGAFGGTREASKSNEPGGEK